MLSARPLRSRAGPALLAALLVLATMDAEAKRLGGGRTIGQTSPRVTQREAAPPAPPAQQAGAAAPGTAPAQQAAPRPAMPPASPGASAPAPRRPWGALLGGLAAGLGLAWLAHSLGLGSAFGEVLLVLLAAVLGFALLGAVLRSRRLATAGAAPMPADVAQPPPQYNPDKVGNDASARPWERNSMSFEVGKATGGGLQIGSALQAPGWTIPAGFDTAGFVAAAKRNFMALQEAWDHADLATLRAMMTDAMVTEIRTQLAEREAHLNGQRNQTDVVMLEAQLLGVDDLGPGYMASVEFSGLIREQPSAGPSPFREVWNLTKPKDGSSGWLVAGVQALA